MLTLMETIKIDIWFHKTSAVPECLSQFSLSVMSDSLQPHESQHSRPPCPTPTPRVYSDSCPSSQWCHPAISSSVVPFSSYPQSLPASGSFPMSQLFAWGGQSTECLNTWMSKTLQIMKMMLFIIKCVLDIS